MSLQVETLRESFKKVKPQADAFVESFYDNLFTDYPAAKPLFEHSDMSKQSTMLKACLLMVVENLRRPGALQEMLSGLGTRHVAYGALPEHYPLVGNSLLKTFEQYLNEDWTPEVKQAWVEAYDAITALMLEGADYSEDDVALKTLTPSETSSATLPETPLKSQADSSSGIAIEQAPLESTPAPSVALHGAPSSSVAVASSVQLSLISTETRSSVAPPQLEPLSPTHDTTASSSNLEATNLEPAASNPVQASEQDESSFAALPVAGGILGIGAAILAILLLL